MHDEPHQGFLDPTEDSRQQSSLGFRFSLVGDVAIPLGVAIVPTSLFLLLGILLQDMNRPGAQMPRWAIVVVVVLQTAGIIAMAVVVLMRREAISTRLTLMSQGPVKRWRISSMLIAIGCLTLFDILLNVSGAFQGARFLAWIAPPMFLIYLVVIKITFIGLRLPE